MRELSSPRVDQSARCPVRELAIRELAYPRVVQLSPYLGRVELTSSRYENFESFRKRNYYRPFCGRGSAMSQLCVCVCMFADDNFGTK